MICEQAKAKLAAQLEQEQELREENECVERCICPFCGGGLEFSILEQCSRSDLFSIIETRSCQVCQFVWFPSDPKKWVKRSFEEQAKIDKHFQHVMCHTDVPSSNFFARLFGRH